MKPTVLFSRSKEDYYGSLSEECRDSHMDSLKVNTEVLSISFTITKLKQPKTSSFKQPDSEESPQARYPQPLLPSTTERNAGRRLEQVQIAASGKANISLYLV